MSARRLVSLSAFLPLLVACQSAFAASGGADPAGPAGGLFPPATRPIEIRVADEAASHLAYLVDELSAATGVAFVSSQPVRQQLSRTPTGFSTDLTVPATEGWSWVEAVLLHHGFRLVVMTQRPPIVLAVVSAMPLAGDPPRQPSYLPVPEAQLDSLEEHPALLVTTVLDLPHTDVRQLGNSLRALTNDPSGAMTIVPVGNTNSVIVSGPAQVVLDLAGMLRFVDDRSREALERGDPGPTPAGPGEPDGPPPGPGDPGRPPPGRG